MGYATHYTLEIDRAPADEPMVSAALAVLNKNDEAASALDGEPMNWYGHEADVAKVSKAFPALTFHLRGEGEQSGDIWVKTFKGGLVQERRAQIVIPPFNVMAPWREPLP